MTTDAAGKKVRWDQVTVPPTNVSVYEALLRRRMAWKFKDRPVPRDAMDRMLATAVWAPNHRLTEPWRFFVMGKDSPLRRRIAQAAYEGTTKEPGAQQRAEHYRQEVLDPPILMYVYYVPGPDEEVTRENYAATVCAVHNISLAGYAEGLTTTWETGRITRVPGLKEAFGAEPNWNVLAMVSIGYADEPSASSRTPVTEFVRWG
jgi:nitroreductase